MKTWDCLIVDDEKLLTESAEEYFNLMGVSARSVPGAAECREFLKGNTARVILLDINLAGESGFELCRELRAGTQVPILFLSARSSDDDKIAAYALGGDDYVQKPCSLSVLLAKVRAVLRRYGRSESAAYDDGKLRIDLSGRTVDVFGRPRQLTATEFGILSALVRRAGRVVTKQELFDEVWPDKIAGDGTLSVHIRHLREQIEENPSRPEYIRTVHGVGFTFVGRC